MLIARPRPPLPCCFISPSLAAIVGRPRSCVSFFVGLTRAESELSRLPSDGKHSMNRTTSLDHRKRWLALLVLCLGVLMIVLDTTIVNVALPSIRTDLGFTETSLVWVVNAYLLTF